MQAAFQDSDLLIGVLLILETMSPKLIQHNVAIGKANKGLEATAMCVIDTQLELGNYRSMAIGPPDNVAEFIRRMELMAAESKANDGLVKGAFIDMKGAFVKQFEYEDVLKNI